MTGAELRPAPRPNEYTDQGLHVRAWTAGDDRLPPAVLLHGAVIAGQYMTPLAAALSAHTRVYVPDLPGCGRSNQLPAPPDVPGVAEGILGWMERESLRGVILVGNSFGGQVASQLAVTEPDSVSALVLIGPTMDPSVRPPLALASRSIEVGLTEPLPLHLLWLRDLARAGLGKAVTCCRAAWQDHVEERLPRVAAATLVVRGARDHFVSQAWAESVVRMTPRAHLMVVEGAGHAAHFKKPYEVGSAILKLVELAAKPGPLEWSA